MRLRRQILCPACRGTGAKDGDLSDCKRCDGKGFTLERRQVGPGFIQQVQVDCKKCEGTGKLSKAECPVCEGRKVQTGDKDIEVYIEQGMPNGAEIMFDGEGDQGPGEAASHIKFHVRARKHPLFFRDGDDLHIDVHITLMEALLGFERTIEHLDGHAVGIERTGVTKPGAKETIKKEGMPVSTIPSRRPAQPPTARCLPCPRNGGLMRGRAPGAQLPLRSRRYGGELHHRSAAANDRRAEGRHRRGVVSTRFLAKPRGGRRAAE